METEGMPDQTAGAAADRYGAFISYRHVEPDRVWAKWLHASLETYRVPKKLARQRNLPRRIGRVFRDEEELPASDDLNARIESALSQSRFLVVVCSPRAVESRWVNREVERFREMGRHARILALLIEGEPNGAFPPALREIRHTVIDRDGASVERVEQVEPLAADVRAVRHESGRYLRRMAKLRLLACILGVEFDDLRRREQERRTRRLAYLGAVLAVLLCVVGGLAVYAFRQRDLAVRERQLAEVRRQEAVEQRRRAEMELAQGTVLQGDLLGSAGRWVEAREKYAAADVLFRNNEADPLAAGLGLWDASRHVSTSLGVLAGHAGGAFSVAVSPDGRRALSGGADQVLRLWDLPTAKALASVPVADKIVRAVAFLPDGGRALSGGDGKTVRLWDLAGSASGPGGAAGRELHAFTGHDAAVFALAVSADGSRFLSGDSAGKVKLWDVAGGNEVRTIDAQSHVYSLAFSPDGRTALCGGSDGKARFFDLSNGQLLRTYGGPGLPASLVAFLPDGKTAVSGGLDNEFQFWDLAGGGAGASPAGNANGNADGNAADAGSTGNVVTKPTRSFLNPTSRVGCAALSADGRMILSGDWDGVLVRFDAETGKVRRSFVGHAAALLRQVAIAPDGRIAVSASSDGSLRVWDLGGGRALRSWHYRGAVNGVGFADEGRLAFTAPGAAPMELWDVASEQTLFTADQPRMLVFNAVLRPDGRSALATGFSTSGANVLALCDLTRARPPLLMAGHEGATGSVAISPDGKAALSGGEDKTARVWDLASGRELHALPHEQRVTLVAFSPDGRLALTGGLAGVRLWDARDWHELRPLAPAATGVADAWGAAAFSPDGRSVLAGMQAGTLELFDAAGGAAPRTFAGAHTKTVGRVAFSPDGRLAASASDDHTLRLWDVASGRELRVLAGHEESAREIAFGPGGRMLLSGGLDHTLNLWDFGSAEAESAALSALSAARDAAARSPGDEAAAATLLAAQGAEYALRQLDDWAIAVLEQARAGGAAVSPLLLGRCYWRVGRLDAARRELAAARDRKEAPAEYLEMCLKKIGADAAAAATRPASGPAR